MVLEIGFGESVFSFVLYMILFPFQRVINNFFSLTLDQERFA